MSVFQSETERLEKFPVAAHRVFLGHAAVTALPACAARAMADHAWSESHHPEDFGETLRVIARTREVCAAAINVKPSEVALLGPTALGLSLFANGIAWKEGDELICHADDYPTNVYPWINLERQGVRPVLLRPAVPGRITPEDVLAALTPRTRMVALATCHFLSGWRIDVPAIAEVLRPRGVLFALDAIQTIGAFPTDASCADFLSADAHKWMLGPMAIGIVAVAERNFEVCRPTLLGAWNVRSPEFIPQPGIEFEETARRYEPGVLNIAGIHGMRASLEMLASVPDVSSRILAVRDELEDLLRAQGFVFLSPDRSEPLRSGILTARHPDRDPRKLFATLEANHITASLRASRDGQHWLRFSPHFYNTSTEIQKVAAVLDR